MPIGQDPQRPAPWVGRATPPPTPSYLPPVQQPPMVVVAVPRRGSGGRTALVAIAIVAAFCALGGVGLWFGLGGFNQKPAGSLGDAPPGLHTAVRDGSFQFVVTAASCGHASVGQSFVSRTAQGQFCLVTVTVTNIGTSGHAFAEGFQKAIGPDGATYGPDPAAGVIVNAGATTVWSTVNPGNSVTGTMVFDIPKGAVLTQVELHDSPLSGGARVTLS